MSPPGLTATHATSGGDMSAETLIKHAHKLLGDCGIQMSPSKVSRLVREYRHCVERNGFRSRPSWSTRCNSPHSSVAKP
jgi:hypothetical protein